MFWLRRAAQERLRATVAARAKGQTDGPRAAARDERARPSHVAVVFSSPQEAVGLVDRLAGLLSTQAAGFRLHEGGLDGRHVIVIAPGDGAAAAAHATAAIIEGHHPQWIIAAGLGTALVPGVARGDAVLAESLILEDGREQRIDSRFRPAMDGGIRRWHMGRLLMLKRPIALPQARAELGEKFGAVSVDAHAWTVGNVCRERSVPFLAMQVIRHAVDDRSPRDLAQLRRRQSLARRMGTLTGTVLRRPASLKDLWREKEQDLIGADALAECLIDVIGELASRGRTPTTGGAAPPGVA